MQLFKRDPKNDIPMSSPISHTMKTVDMIFPQSTKREPLLYFVVFKGITDLELMGMRSYVIEYSEDCIHVTKRARVAIDKVGKAMQLCDTLRKMGITCKEDDNLRLSLVKNGKFVKVFSPDDELPTSVSTIRVDVVSYEDLHPSDDERVLQFVLCAPDPMKNAKPLNMCFMKRVKLDSKISEIKLLAKEAFGVDEDLNFMFGQELAKVTKSSFFDEHSTIKEILSKDKREDPPIYVIKKSTDKVGVMSCTEANQSIVIYN